MKNTDFIPISDFLNESELLDYMKQVAEMFKGQRQGDFWQWKVAHAKVLNHVHTDDIRKQYPQINEYLRNSRHRPVQKECYKNAGQLAMNCEGVDYVEGEISYHGIPIEHAWNKIDGKYFDITKDVLFPGNSDYAEYVSIIELNEDEYRGFIIKYKHWGGFVYEQYEKEHPTKVEEGVTDKAKEKMFGVIDPDTDFDQIYKGKTLHETEKDKIVYKYPDFRASYIIKNPTSLKDFEDSVRGVIDPEGNLYMQNHIINTHQELIYILAKLNIIKEEELWFRRLPKHFLTVQRYWSTNNIIIGESNEPLFYYNYEDGKNLLSKYNSAKSYDDAHPHYKKFMDAAQAKNPQFNFVADVRKNLKETDLKESSKMDNYYEKNFGITHGYNSEVVNSYDVVAKVGKYHTPIIKNPKSLEGFDPEVRAISDSDGNLYVSYKRKYFNHGELANALVKAGIIDTFIYNVDAKVERELKGVYEDQNRFLLFDRIEDEDIFVPSDTFEWEGVETEKLLNAVKKKNPQFQFDIRYFDDYDIDDEEIGNEVVESFHYPKLFESPDDVHFEGKNYSTGSSLTYAFEVIFDTDNDKIIDVLIASRAQEYHGGDPATNGPIRGKPETSPRWDGKQKPYGVNWKKIYPGRLYFDPQVITFWVYPTDDELKTIVSIIEKKKKIKIYDNDWKIEIYPEGRKNKGVQGYSNNYDRDKESKIIPIEEYIGSKRPPEKAYLQHLDTKTKHKVPYGYGSKNPAYKSKRQWQMASLTDEGKKEEHYPRLLE
jgi:hypothetical protein